LLRPRVPTAGSFKDTDGVVWTGGLSNYDGSAVQHVAFATQYDILPTAEDPRYIFAVSSPINNQDA
jgi:4-hydroxyphenylpyruvate dioxygenase-like putative hemolysin